MKSIAGFLLAGTLGLAATVGGLSSSMGGSVGAQTIPNDGCFSHSELFQACTPARIRATSVVNGSSTPPAGGWTINITSPNCTFIPPGSESFTLPAGGVGTSGPLPVYSAPAQQAPTQCIYHLTQTPTSGWTYVITPSTLTVDAPDAQPAAFSPPDNAFIENVTVTNTSPTLTLGPCTITGTSGDDKLGGTPGPDVICGLGGKDVIHGWGGNDKIYGGSGPDKIYGDKGSDSLFGGRGEDRCFGGPGIDPTKHC